MTDMSNANSEHTCGIYVHFRPDDDDSKGPRMVERCREYADKVGWAVAEPWVYVEEAPDEVHLWDREQWGVLLEAAHDQLIDTVLVPSLVSLSTHTADVTRAYRTARMVGCRLISVGDEMGLNWVYDPEGTYRAQVAEAEKDPRFETGLPIGVVKSRTGLADHKIRRLVEKGEFPAPFTTFPLRLWDPEEVEDWCQQHQQSAS